MAITDIRQRPGVIFAATVVLHVVLISTQVTTRTGVPLFQVAVFGTFAEVQRMVTTGIDSARQAWGGYVALQQVRSENASLRQELNALQIRLQEERALAQRTEALRQLVDLRQRTGLDTTGAEVIAAGPTPEFKTLTIGKGRSDGLARDMAVIAPSGVVGRVTLTSARAAQVQLLVDSNAAAGALVERTRAQGVAIGVGDGTIRLQYVPSTADVQVGDTVVTAGIDGIYPRGFVIGKVTSVERGAGVYQSILVQPAVAFDSLEEVLVVLTPPPARAEELPAAPPAVPPAAAPSAVQPPAGEPR
jgi:rod shape-determining protein MreC